MDASGGAGVMWCGASCCISLCCVMLVDAYLFLYNVVLHFDQFDQFSEGEGFNHTNRKFLNISPEKRDIGRTKYNSEHPG